MGALRRHPGGIAEVKRMFTDPAFRGQGLGHGILNQIEAMARREGYNRLVLETGSNFDAAKYLYESTGFTPSDIVLNYPASPWNAFYEKELHEKREEA